MATRSRGAVALLAAGAALAGAPGEARASDKFATSLDIAFFGVFSAMDVGGLRLKAADEPALLRGVAPWLTGQARMLGTAQRVGLSLHGLRFGVGVGALAAPGLRVRHERPALEVDARGAWAMPMDGYAVYAPGDPRWYRFYGGFAGGLTMFSVTLSAGEPGVPYRGFVGGLSARAGALIELNQYFYVDLGGSAGLLGADVFQFSAALGLPIPLANL